MEKKPCLLCLWFFFHFNNSINTYPLSRNIETIFIIMSLLAHYPYLLQACLLQPRVLHEQWWDSNGILLLIG